MIYYGLMMQWQRILGGVVVACAAVAALAQTPSAPQAGASQTIEAGAPEPSRLNARLLYELLLAELLAREGQAQQGAAYMLSAARRVGDEALFKRARRHAFPQSAQAGQYELQVLIVLGRVAETEEPARHFLATLPDAEKLSFITALPALYQRVPDKAEAARVIERALDGALGKPALAPAAWTSIGRLRLQAGDKAGALVAATLGQNADAQSEWPALLGLQLMASGETQAEALVERHLATAQARPELYIAYARGLIEQGRGADAHRQLDRLIRRAPEHPESWLVRGALYADERRDAEAESDLRRYLGLLEAMPADADAEQPEGSAHARMMLAGIAERRGDLAQARQWLESVDSPEQALAVQTRLAQLLARQGRLDEARQLIRAVPERNAEDARLKLLAEAQLLRDNRQPQQAYDLLSGALQQTPDEETLLYDTAPAAERVGQFDAMERLLRRLIELKPEAAQAYNALGYSLADRNLRLPEARALIDKAVQLAPDDAYIQDSLGWVQFRQGNLRQARKTLEAAFKKRPDAGIAAHRDEVLWSQGEREGALRVWRDGQRLDADNETLKKTLLRFRVRL